MLDGLAIKARASLQIPRRSAIDSSLAQDNYLCDPQIIILSFLVTFCQLILLMKKFFILITNEITYIDRCHKNNKKVSKKKINNGRAISLLCFHISLLQQYKQELNICYYSTN